MSNIEYFIRIVKEGDFNEVESARDNVKKENLAALELLYWILETWEQKIALINLIQDYIDPITHRIMLDILKAPEDEKGDYIELTKAIALCHLDKDFSKFDAYYKNRELITQNAKHYLEKN